MKRKSCTDVQKHAANVIKISARAMILINYLHQFIVHLKPRFLFQNLGGYPEEPTTTMEGYPTTAPPTTATTTAVTTSNDDGSVIKQRHIVVFCIV